jgi:hypothetical protein
VATPIAIANKNNLQEAPKLLDVRLNNSRSTNGCSASLPKAEQEAPQWQTAAEVLMLIAEHGGDLMMARIAMMRALHRREPQATLTPRRKRATP